MGINTLPNRATDILHPPAYEDGTDKEFRNVGYQEPDAGESPEKEQITTAKFLIQNVQRAMKSKYTHTEGVKFPRSNFQCVIPLL